MIRRPPRSTPLYSSAASDVYKRQLPARELSVSWYGTLDILEEMPRAIENICLEIDFKDLDSKHRFRTKLRSARCSFPKLKTIVAPKTGRLHHHDLLVEEGISVILTQSYSTTSSPRRPTPIGWPCRNIQWGLWEVSRDTPKQQVRIGNFFSCMIPVSYTHLTLPTNREV